MRTFVGAGFKPALFTMLVASCILMPQVVRASKVIPAKVRFAPVHIYLDPAGKPLAAYQFELVCATPIKRFPPEEDNASRLRYEPQVKIVGVEGGEHPAFKEAPYYDPAALQNDRIIIAAFNTGSDLPTTRTRIATIHLQITGDAEPKYELKLIATADTNAEEITAELILESGASK
jgi:hypothetical protein